MRPRKFFNGSQDLIKELNDLNDDIGVLEQKVEENGIGTTFVENEQALNDLIAQGKIYDGMILYREDTKKFYRVSKSSDGQLVINEFADSTTILIRRH